MKDVVVWTITSLKMYQIQTEATREIITLVKIYGKKWS